MIIRRVPLYDAHAGYGSVYDVLHLIFGQPREQLYIYWNRMVRRTPEWGELPRHTFSGDGDTPVADSDMLLEIIWTCNGVNREAQRSCAKLVHETFLDDGTRSITTDFIDAIEGLVAIPTDTVDGVAMFRYKLAQTRDALIAEHRGAEV